MADGPSPSFRAAAATPDRAKRRRLGEPVSPAQPSASAAPTLQLDAEDIKPATSSPLGDQQHTEGLTSPAAASASSGKQKRSRAQKVPERLKPGTGVPEALGDQPLRLMVVGSNPSDHAWATGCYYSNPVNYM